MKHKVWILAISIILSLATFGQRPDALNSNVVYRSGRVTNDLLINQAGYVILEDRLWDNESAESLPILRAVANGQEMWSLQVRSAANFLPVMAYLDGNLLIQAMEPWHQGGYGHDRDQPEDRPAARFLLMALDSLTGEIKWQIILGGWLDTMAPDGQGNTIVRYLFRDEFEGASLRLTAIDALGERIWDMAVVEYPVRTTGDGDGGGMDGGMNGGGMDGGGNGGSDPDPGHNGRD